MRITLIVLLLIGLAVPAFAVGKVTTDPNTAAAATAKDTDEPLADIRLGQTVAYSQWNKPVLAILEDLSKATGVTLKAGVNSRDWQVRDRKMSIFAKDVSLGEIMGSVGRVMKFKWEKSGDEGQWTYKLFMDRRTLLDAEAQRVRQEQQQEAEQAKRRQDGFMEYAKLGELSDADKVKLKTENPFMYVAAQSGLGGSMGAFFTGTPGAVDAMANGQRLDLNGSALSTEAQAGLLQAMRQMTDMETKFSGGKSNRTLPDNLGEDPSKISVSINQALEQTKGMPMGGMLLGDVTIKYDGGSMTVPMFDPNSDAAKLIGKALIESEEQGRSMDEVMKDHMTEFMNVMTKALKTEAGGEPLTKHADDPALDAKVTLKADSQKLPDVEKALAEASKYAVVSDYFVSIMPGPQTPIPAVETPLKDILAKIEDGFVCNWDKHGSVIELRDRNWFKKRAAQLPEERLEAWRQELIKTGTLDIDSLAQIAQLDQEQLMANIYPDETLRGCLSSYYSAKDVLRLYATLTQNQRAALFADTGLDLASLSQDQFAMVDKLIRAKHSQDLDANVPISVVCERKAFDKTYRYSVSLIVDGQKGSSEWLIMTPAYTPPPPPKDPKTAKPADGAKPADSAAPAQPGK
jgi:hypothetical protein